MGHQAIQSLTGSSRGRFVAAKGSNTTGAGLLNHTMRAYSGSSRIFSISRSFLVYRRTSSRLISSSTGSCSRDRLSVAERTRPSPYAESGELVRVSNQAAPNESCEGPGDGEGVNDGRRSGS